MTDRDPIASPTLALLYLSQGHFGRARSIVSQLLERDPSDGYALVLTRRLRARGNARTSCELDGDRIVLSWQGADTGDDLHLVWVLTRHAPPLTRVSSRPCEQSFGSLWIPRPWPRGAVTCCIGRRRGEGDPDASPAFVPVAVGPVCTWGK